MVAQRFAFKSSAQFRNGAWYDVFKDPIDSNKKSKKGRLKLIQEGDTYKTVSESDPRPDVMQLVFEDGFVVNQQTFSEIRERAKL